MDRVKPIAAADGIVRGSDRPVSKARIELNRTDGFIVRAGEHSAANGTTNFSVQRESEQRKDQERFHATQYGAFPKIVALAVSAGDRQFERISDFPRSFAAAV